MEKEPSGLDKGSRHNTVMKPEPQENCPCKTSKVDFGEVVYQSWFMLIL